LSTVWYIIDPLHRGLADLESPIDPIAMNPAVARLGIFFLEAKDQIDDFLVDFGPAAFAILRSIVFAANPFAIPPEQRGEIGTRSDLTFCRRVIMDTYVRCVLIPYSVKYPGIRCQIRIFAIIVDELSSR
jgi:hypothetical protein